MFKGLRTKIESEQKGQNNQKVGSTATTTTKQGANRVPKHDVNQPTGSSPAITEPSTLAETNNPSLQHSKHDPETKPTSFNAEHDSATTITPMKDSKLDASQARTKISHNQVESNSSANASGNKTVKDLESQISKLHERLQAVIKERQLDADQNAQSNRLIATLQKDLSQERASKSALESRLHEVETKLKEQADNVNNKTNRAANNNAFIKSFNPDGHNATISDGSLSGDVVVLRHEIINLQAQLAKKNRQLKISQQNLTDMKRSLQKEILEHGKTQDELAKLQRQIRNHEQDALDSKDGPMPTQNGNNLDRLSDHNTNQVSGDKCKEVGNNATGSQVVVMPEDVISFNAALGNSNQFDRVSCLSRSSASVDDLDSNDLQSNHNKEVSHEYLRNVLFRYMTSTDIETTQHLVKAISVLMDFTPEQSASIKSAMNGKASSWLRLK